MRAPERRPRAARSTEHGRGSPGRVSEPQHHVIDVRLVAPPMPLERPVMAPPVITRPHSMWVQLPRGEIALEIEMPARLDFKPLAIMSVSVAPIALFASLVLWLLDGGSQPALYLAILGMPAVFVLLIWVLTYAPFEARETLEIDSRVVALRRGSTYLAAWNRSDFDGVRVTEPDKPRSLEGKRTLGGKPTLAWGFQKDGASPIGGAGSGISHETASRILAEIQHFCAENPAGPVWQIAPWEPGPMRMTRVRGWGV